MVPTSNLQMPKENQPYVKRYTEAEIQNALEAIRNGMSKKMAAKKLNVPRATIQFRLSNNFIKTRPGPSTVLTDIEERQLVEWLTLSSRKGFPRRKDDVLDSVQHFLKNNPRENSFIDNRPGKGWYKLFLQRHPELTLRQSEAVTSASSKISETDIRKWFHQIEQYLKDMNYYHILNDPSRVFNGDETGFLFNPKNAKVIAPKGDKNDYEVEHAPSKTSLTVMFTFSASGVTTPPMVVYPLKRMRAEIIRSVSESWGVGMSENGCMKSETFFSYIKNVLHPYLVKNGTQFPIILFLDGHKSHTTLELSQLCQGLDIILISLYPNATRLLQPADVAAFRPIKSAWRKAVLDWRKENLTKTLTKVDFGPILEKVVNHHINPNIVKNGFRACGIVPWNPDAVDYSKCLGTQQRHLTNAENISTDPHLSYSQFQQIVGPSVMRRLQNNNTSKSVEGKALLKVCKSFLLANQARQEEQLDDEFVHVDVTENDHTQENIDEAVNIVAIQNKNDNTEEIQTKKIIIELSNDTEEIRIEADGIDTINNVTEPTHLNINGTLVPIDEVPIFTSEEMAVDRSIEINTSVENRKTSPIQNTSPVTITPSEFTPIPSLFETAMECKTLSLVSDTNDISIAPSELIPMSSSFETAIYSKTPPLVSNANSISSNEFIPTPSCSYQIESNEKTPEKRPITLKQTLTIPKTPIRNSRNKETIKDPFVLTSIDWQKIQINKLEMKNKLIMEKEDRKRKRQDKSREKKEIIAAKIKKKDEDKKVLKSKANKPSLIKRTKNVLTKQSDEKKDILSRHGEVQKTKVQLTKEQARAEEEQSKKSPPLEEEKNVLKGISCTQPKITILSNIHINTTNKKMDIQKSTFSDINMPTPSEIFKLRPEKPIILYKKEVTKTEYIENQQVSKENFQNAKVRKNENLSEKDIGRILEEDY